MPSDLLIFQLTPEQAETLWTSPRFFVAVFAGLVIALAFQLLLTNLSVALGLTAASGIDEPGDESTDNSADSSSLSIAAVGDKVRKANAAFGVWALVTGSLALFLGAWLGVELSLTVDATAGAVVGLVIWGLFYFSMLFIEASIVGSLVRRAAGGFTSATRSLGAVFTKSPSKEVAQTAADVAAAVRDELLEDRRVRDLGKEIGRAVDRLEQNTDPAALREELETLLDRTEVEATIEEGERTPEGESAITASLKTSAGPQKSKLARMGGAVSSTTSVIEEEVDSDKSRVDSTADAALRISGLSAEKAAAHRERFEEYLRSTDDDSLDPDGIKRDLELMFDDPKEGWEALKERFSDVDRSTLESILTARGMSEDRANTVVGWAEAALMKISGAPSASVDAVKRSADEKLRAYLVEVDDPKLRYASLRDELELLLDDPRAGADALIRRLESLDRDSLKSILAARKGTSEEDAERYLSAMESARDTVLERTRKAKAEVERRLEVAKQKSLESAEELRKTASTAAWWAFGAASASGAAAALGGVVAVMTGVG